MTDVVRALTEAFGEEPSKPSEPSLGGGVRAHAYWSFAPNLEVVVGDADRLPSDGQALTAWRTRLGRRPIPLVLVIEANGSSLVVGPSGNPAPVVSVDPRLVVADLAQAAQLDPHDVRARLPRVWEQARGAGGLSGLRNVGLFSTHFLRDRAPRSPGWADFEQAGRTAVRGRTLLARLDGLGFEHEQRTEGIYVLRAQGRPAAAVLSYPAGQDLDRAAGGGELPVASLLREVDAVGAEWGILASGEVWRLYAAEHPARTTSFLELDLSKLTEPAYYAALFSARALQRDGSAKAISEGSRDFAVALGGRLRDRIYLEVVPRLAGAVADELERLGDSPVTRAQLEAVYDATLILLYRLLFVLYAEAREYLPVTASIGYREHSLRQRLDSIIATVEAERDFDPRATDIWSDLQETFAAIANGHLEWGVPAYNGGLFHDDLETPAGEVLSRISPSNTGLGQALYHLAFDRGAEDTGRIDYSDLEIRHLGDIYEGLLQFEADRATEDLAYDSRSDSYVPAEGGAEVVVPAGAVYLRGRSGGRKASGSYYTPQIVVRRLVDEALVPVLDDHLAEVGKLLDRGDVEAASRLLFAFRVCDPAMGSGHFLVDALDVLTDRIAAFLSERPIKPVRSTLNQLREMVQTQARDLPVGVLAEIRDVELLKRIVLKRSIYGVDLNPMAVELAKLALWLDAFVPGLPLSFLDHNLKRGNSLVGVIGDEVLQALTPDQATIDDPWHIAESLGRATERARDAVERVELRLQDVQAAEEAERERQEVLRDVEMLYHRWTAESFALPGARGRITERDTLEGANDEREAIKVSLEQRFFHWPLEFPEVFARERPGFDVVLANPPWEKLKVERHDFYQRFIPSLKRVESAAARERLIAALPDEMHERYEAEVRRIAGLKPYFAAASGNYRLHGSGDADLFKAFAERFMGLARNDGAVGCVLPRPLVAAAGCEPLRREYFTRWTIKSVDMVWNQRRWAFPGINDRVQSVLLAARKQRPGDDAVIPSASPLNDEARFRDAAQFRVRYPLRALQVWSPSLDLPSLPDAEAGDVFAAMMRHPRFDDESREWRAVPYCELHSSGDRDLYNEEGHGWPVWKGNTFERYRPDNAPPVYWADPEAVFQRITEARRGEPLRCRLVYRNITGSQNRRSMIACLAPPNVFVLEHAPQFAWPRGTPHDVASLLGVFNSLAFDWLIRRRVETHITFSILNPLPIPHVPAGVADLAGRLSCIDDRYADFAASAGVECGPLTTEEAIALEAEIDALVAHAYELSREQLEVIFSDFVEAAAPESYRQLVREYYDRATPLV